MDIAQAIMSNISHIADEANNAAAQLDGQDYTDDQGLVVCRKCGKRKQKRISPPRDLAGMFPESVIVRIMCDCEEKQKQIKDQEMKHTDRMIQIARYRDMSLMDKAFRDSRFCNAEENSNNARALKIAHRYVENFDGMMSQNQGLLFYGTVGTGKTFLSACIANELLDQCVPVIMTSLVKLLQNIQGNPALESEYVRSFDSARLLILDDLGAERNTDYALEKVYNIIDSRNRSGLPMILTTNLRLEDMMNTPDIRYKRIYDRILDTCYPVELIGESFRSRSAADRFDRMKGILEGGNDG